MAEGDKRSPLIPAEQEENISIVHENDDQDDVDPDNNVQISETSELPKASEDICSKIHLCIFLNVVDMQL